MADYSRHLLEAYVVIGMILRGTDRMYREDKSCLYICTFLLSQKATSWSTNIDFIIRHLVDLFTQIKTDRIGPFWSRHNNSMSSQIFQQPQLSYFLAH